MSSTERPPHVRNHGRNENSELPEQNARPRRRRGRSSAFGEVMFYVLLLFFLIVLALILNAALRETWARLTDLETTLTAVRPSP